MGKCSGCGKRRRTIIASGTSVCRDCFVIDVADRRIPATRINWQARAQAAEATIAAVRRLCEKEAAFREGMPSGYSQGALEMAQEVLEVLDAPAASANAARGEERP